MPSTYTLISSNVLSSPAASVTFSAIPSTYTDLVIRGSARSDSGAIGRDIYLRFNGTTTNGSATELANQGASGTSTRYTTIDYAGQFNGSGTTSNTFNSIEVYIPNYNSSANKPMSTFNALENNSATIGDTYLGVWAGLWSNTAAITSVTLNFAGTNAIAGSSFYLYGISKN